MAKKETKNRGTRDGELSEQQLDRVSGGQEVRKMGTIVVTAQRDKPDFAGTKVASADPPKHK